MWLEMQADGDLGAEPSETGEREPIAVFGVDAVLEGTIPKLEGRLTEHLGHARRVHVRPADAGNAAKDQMVLELDDVVAVAAAPRPPSPFRVARRQHAIEITAGRYQLRGVAHLPHGADPHRYVASAPRKWLPLTQCTVSTSVDQWSVDTVIVNLDHASREPSPQVPPPFG